MAIVNFGSVNIDHVYRVAHFVRPGETLATEAYARLAGGKGCNQSIALAHAGATVRHAGRIGADGDWIRRRLAAAGVNVTPLLTDETPTGHAIIQVNAEGENCILLHGGANRRVTAQDGAAALDGLGAGDWALFQNEISAIPDLMRLAAARGLRIAFNPAPMTAAVRAYPLELADLLILNQVEAGDLTGATTPSEMLDALRRLYPRALSVLTLGRDGACCADNGGLCHEAALPVKVVDTTAAGDTFVGFFLAELMAHRTPPQALRAASRAAAVCVMRPGAMDSIPTRAEVEVLLSVVSR